MAEVETAIKRLTKNMEEYGSLPNLFCTGESDAGTIMRKSGELRHKLRGVYYGIADNWLRIIENKVLRDEVTRYLASYTGLKDASRKLRLMLKDSPESELQRRKKGLTALIHSYAAYHTTVCLRYKNAVVLAISTYSGLNRIRTR